MNQGRPLLSPLLPPLHHDRHPLFQAAQLAYPPATGAKPGGTVAVTAGVGLALANHALHPQNAGFELIQRGLSSFVKQKKTENRKTEKQKKREEGKKGGKRVYY